MTASSFPDLTLTVLAGAVVAVLAFATLAHPTRLVRWLQKKRFQYEVTFSLYMMTPTEKFVFNSFLFLFLGLFIIAAALYLPEHVSMIASRAFYYYAGDPLDPLSSATAPREPALAAPASIDSTSAVAPAGSGIAQ